MSVMEDVNMKVRLVVLFWVLIFFSCNNFRGKPMTFEVHGIDVSHFQGKIDWPMIRDQGVSFAFIKATEGLDHCDTMFYNHWKSIKLANVKRGAYHFFIPNIDATEQAQNFLMNVSLQNGDLPPVLDMEITDHENPEELVKSIREWLETVSTAFNAKPIIYTNLKAYYRFIAGRFDEYPIWIARYSEKAPELGNDKKWDFWQYDNNGKVNGIKQDVDLNAFNGSYQDLEGLCIKNLPTSNFLNAVGKPNY